MKKFSFICLVAMLVMAQRCLFVNGQTYALKSDTRGSGYCADERGMTKCNRGHIQQWEKFTFYYRQMGFWYIVGGQGGYCHARNGEFKCDSNGVIDANERWHVHHLGGDQYAIQNFATGKYVVTEEKRKNVMWWTEHEYYYLRCDRGAIGPWEKFKFVPQ